MHARPPARPPALAQAMLTEFSVVLSKLEEEAAVQVRHAATRFKARDSTWHRSATCCIVAQHAAS
jgi:hypothetical protein